MNNTFEDAKKAKWIIKFIQKQLSIREIENVSIKYASLFLEEDEDVKIYEEIIEPYSCDSDFEGIILFGAVIENDVFQCSFRMPDNWDGMRLELWKKDEEDSILSDLDWRVGLDYIIRTFTRPESEKEQYEYLFKRLEPHGYI